jgi:hypothetical protein
MVLVLAQVPVLVCKKVLVLAYMWVWVLVYS